MKKLYTIIGAVLITASVFAQTPEKMSYQAVIRNISDALVTNTNVGMQISILQGSSSGTLVYEETLTPTTNINGLVSIEIGTGTVVSGDFTTIDWSAGPYFIMTETDPTGGTAYTITGTSQLLSVPYALHAKTAENVFSGDYNDLANQPTIPTLTSDLTNDSGFITSPDDADADPANEIQDISLAGTDLTISSGSTIDLSVIDTDTQLDETAVDAFVANNGYLTTEVDGSVTNEIQDISLAGTDLSISSGSTIDLSVIDTDTQLDEAAVDAFVANNGYLTTEVDGDATNELQDITLAGTDLTISSGSTIDLSVIDTDTQLDETAVDAFVANNGYLTTEVDGSVTNEIELPVGGTSGQVLETDGSGNYTWVDQTVDTDTQLDETAVDAFVANNGYLTTEVDGDATNELQDITLAGTDLTISSGSTIDLSVIDTDTQLDETAVDAFVANNGYLTTEVDGDATNELQDITLAGTDLTISSGSTIDLSVIDTDTQLNETEVDAFVANNGYLTSETDPSIPTGTQTSEMLYWNGSAWVIIPATVNEGATLQMIGGVPTWTGGTIPPLAVGDSYQGGIIAYILTVGDPGYIVGETHGLIAAISDQSTGIRWYNGPIVGTGASGIAIGTGLSNTNSIITVQGAITTSYAAGLARAYTGGGYNDWYLPSQNELTKLYLNKVIIGGFANNYYWSSTELAANSAWNLNFLTGTSLTGGFNKANTYRVRAIRAF